MEDDQIAQEEEGGDSQNVEEGVINGPRVQLPRFGVVREHDFFNPANPVRAHRVPIGNDGGDEPVLVLDKDLRWSEADADYSLLSVFVAEGARNLLSALTEEEWQRASPAAGYNDFVRVLATGPNNVEYELHLRHCVLQNEPEYDLTHGWRRVVADYRLMVGDTVEGYAYRDVEDDQLRLELRFSRGDLNLN